MCRTTTAKNEGQKESVGNQEGQARLEMSCKVHGYILCARSWIRGHSRIDARGAIDIHPS